MPRLLAPRVVTKEFTLEKDGEVLTVTAKQATGAEELKRDQILNSPMERDLSDSMTVKVHIPTSLERTAVLAWLSLVDTNVEDPDGKPAFRKDMPLHDFKVAWAGLPEIWQDLIMETVLEANPDWRFR
jgi:hypothetical protein